MVWHSAQFGLILAAKGRHEIVDLNAFQAHQSILAKRVRQPKPPHIQTVLKRAHELKARLKSDPKLTQESLARELGLNPGQFTRILKLADLAPEIQQHILALPPSIHRNVVTERRMRPIAKLSDRKQQLNQFQELLRRPVRAKKAASIAPAASAPHPIAQPGA